LIKSTSFSSSFIKYKLKVNKKQVKFIMKKYKKHEKTI